MASKSKRTFYVVPRDSFDNGDADEMVDSAFGEGTTAAAALKDARLNVQYAIEDGDEEARDLVVVSLGAPAVVFESSVDIDTKVTLSLSDW